MKILLLEDDVALNRAIKKVTQLDGHITQSFFDGQKVLDWIDTVFDLYILDINVPNVNGLELLRIIYEMNKSAKVLMISANTDIDSLQKAYKLGCMDYLKKPFHLEELRIKIAQLAPNEQDLLQNISLKEGFSLTKKEKILLQLLLSNSGKTVTYEMIEESVYREGTISMDSLRALVKRVRAKLDKKLIANVLEEGYVLKVYM